MNDNLKYNKERRDKQFWIDRSGKIHKYDGDLNDSIISFHYRIANKLYPESNRPDDILIDLGWIMVGSTVYNCPIIHKKPTQTQINKLYDLNLYDNLCFLYKGYYVNYVKYQILCD